MNTFNSTLILVELSWAWPKTWERYRVYLFVNQDYHGFKYIASSL